VLVRTRQEFACTTNYFGQLRRAIWDGDQLLYEIAAPGHSGAAPAVMERDTGLAPNFKLGFYETGRVEYVHGAELDAPLAMYRAEYSDSIGGGFYVPLANWKGSYDSGYSIEYCYTRQWSTAVAPPIGEPSTGGDTGTPGSATSGTETLCPTVEWPAQHEWAAHQYRRGYGGPRNWMGSLIYGQRDFSGLHYRRNRFYDAEQGRFTQEDPIGMAGGINLYGFANGDPVTYSDPYGLSAQQCCTVTNWSALKHVVDKHVLGRFGTRWNMFADMDDRALRHVIRGTVENGRVVARQMVDGEARLVFERNWKSAVGTRGEQIVRVVVSEGGELRTAFPVRNAMLSGAARATIGAASGVAGMAAEHLMNPGALNAHESSSRAAVEPEEPLRELPQERSRFRPARP
jgi:RHS repeat-associated protein